MLPLGPVVQYSDALPGGPLAVHVFPGQNGQFALIEDDGVTTAYEQGVFRTTNFLWSESSRTLSWFVTGAHADQNTFLQVSAVVHFPGGAKQSAIAAIGAGGSFIF